MDNVSCAHEACLCTISTASPEPFCCDRCRERSGKGGRCDCGHAACGGIEGKAADEAPSALNPESLANRQGI